MNMPDQDSRFSEREEEALRHLIRAGLHEAAPEDMSSRVLKQLQADPIRVKKAPEPLIPVWCWVLICTVFIGVTYSVCTGDQQIPGVGFFELIKPLPIPQIKLSFTDRLVAVDYLSNYLVILAPILVLQFYLFKRYYDGQYI